MAWNFALIVNEMTECQPYEIALVGVHHVLCVFELFLCVFDGVTMKVRHVVQIERSGWWFSS